VITKITIRTEPSPVLKFDDLPENSWFVDSSGDLGFKVSEGNRPNGTGVNGLCFLKGVGEAFPFMFYPSHEIVRRVSVEIVATPKID
jgi:hypothetical protein